MDNHAPAHITIVDHLSEEERYAFHSHIIPRDGEYIEIDCEDLSPQVWSEDTIATHAALKGWVFYVHKVRHKFRHGHVTGLHTHFVTLYCSWEPE